MNNSNNDCEIDSKSLQCKLCGFQFGNANIKKNCSKKRKPVQDNIDSITTDNTDSSEVKKVKPRKILDKVTKFSIEAIKHALKGNPTCTQQQIDERHAICLQCKIYTVHLDREGKKTEVGHCESCGCNVNKVKKYINKLAWADQECPKKKWLSLKSK